MKFNSPIIKYLTISIVGMGITFILLYWLNHQENEIQKSNQDNAISKIEDKLKEEIRKVSLVLQSLEAFQMYSDSVSKESFETFTLPFIKELDGIRALEWAPLVTKYQKLKLDSLGVKGESVFTITERESSNKMIKAKLRDIYFPVLYISPIQGNEQALGFDLFSNSKRKECIQNTINTRGLSITSPIQLVQQTDSTFGFLAMKSVYDSNREVQGIVLAVYDMSEFVESIIAEELNYVEIKIVDKNDVNGLLYRSISDISEESLIENNSIELFIGDRTWEIKFYDKSLIAKKTFSLAYYLVLIGGILITGLLLLMLYQLDKHREGLEEKIQTRTKELELSNEQKKRLLQEIHHRVKNNLQITASILSLQRSKVSDKIAIEALENSKQQINAIALIHKKLYQDYNVDKVDLKGFLIEIVKDYKRNNNFESNIESDDIFINISVSTPLALITSELILNSIKHGFKGSDGDNLLSIKVFQPHQNLVEIEFIDNGIGFSENIDIRSAKTLGLELVVGFCDQINAVVNYSSDSNGTKFKIGFDPRY